MAEALIAHPEIVGVAPFLTEDSLPKTWPQLYKKKGSGPNDLNDVNFLDNLATLWRAEWCATHKPRRSLPPPLRSNGCTSHCFGVACRFDSIGVFDPDELRGFGVDTENSYLARLSGRRVVVHQGEASFCSLCRCRFFAMIRGCT